MDDHSCWIQMLKMVTDPENCSPYASTRSRLTRFSRRSLCSSWCSRLPCLKHCYFNFLMLSICMWAKSVPSSLFFSRNLKNLNPSSDFKMNQIFEILSDFAHSEVWWSWNSTLSKDFEKSRFPASWTPDLLQKPLSPIRISAAFSRSAAYSAPKPPEISFFQKQLKTQKLTRIKLQNGQIPTESRSCGLNWSPKVPNKNSSFSHISSNFSWKCAVKVEFACFLLSGHQERT